MLRRLVYDYLSDAEASAVNISEVRLGPPARMPEWARGVVRTMLGSDVVVSEVVHTRVAEIRAGDVVVGMWAHRYKVA